MRISKDIYEYLTNFVDDRTIVNMLSVNKKFNDEHMFYRILLRKYPLLLNFKVADESYRKLFVRMTSAIDQMSKIDVPYIQNPKFDPETLFKKYNCYKKINSKFLHNCISAYAVEIGRIDILKMMLDQGALGNPNINRDERHYILEKCCEKGYLDILSFLFARYLFYIPRSEYVILEYIAEKYNQVEIINYLSRNRV